MHTEKNTGWFCDRQQGLISGVCAGLANNYHQPRWLIRVLALMLLITAPLITLCAYFIAAVLLPKR